MIRLPGERPTHAYACSRAGCDASALWAIRWRNPKIHAADKQKHWLACDEHLEYLSEFLRARSFPLEILSVAELGDCDIEDEA